MGEVKKNSVLVVDDESANIMMLTDILKHEYTVYAAKTGKGAIAAAENFLPDAILLDIIMPETDGYAVISALKNSEITKDIPVIFVTGLCNIDDETKGFAMGASDYITKPFSPAIVKLRVKNQVMLYERLRMIERLSMIDQLTDLPNRRSFDCRLNTEWGRAIRDKVSISILVLDIDNFKIYNDTYGHLQGDVALKTVAKIFSQELKRPIDFAARWGGEEFIVLLPYTDLNGAVNVAEHIRADIEKTDIFCADGSVANVTVSIGVNTLIPEKDNSTAKFISTADEALYTAKRMGRNRVVCMDNIVK